MRNAFLLSLLSLSSATGLASEPPSADLKVGTGVEQWELTGASERFEVAPDTKLYLWTRVKGLEEGTVTVRFEKEGREATTIPLKVPKSPYRTHAYRTFRAGDDGEWTVRILNGEQELGKTTFTVVLKP